MWHQRATWGVAPYRLENKYIPLPGAFTQFMFITNERMA